MAHNGLKVVTDWRSRAGDVGMSIKYAWQKSYMTALLETDWTKMPDRLRAAEAELCERERVLSEESGSARERQSMADAINGMKILRKDMVAWQKRQSPGISKAQPD